MIYELRTYRIREGYRDSWVALMDTRIIPFQQKMGMSIVGSFIAIDNDSLYVWIRRFENETERQRLYDAVYGSETWIHEMKPAMGDMLIREDVQVRLLSPTRSSALR